MKKKIRRLKKLYQKMYMDKWTAFVIVVLCLATAAMHVEISLMLEPMINKSLEVQSIAWRETAVFLGCSVIFILLKFFRKMMFAASCCKSELKWNQIAMDWLNAYGMQALENVREGEVAAVISKRIRDFQEFLETHLEGIIYIPLDFFLTFLAVFFIDYRTGLIILPVIAFGIFVDIRLSDKLVKSSKRAYDAENNVLSFQKEVVENAENIILSGMARYVIDRHTALINSKLEADNRLTAEQQYSYIPALINEYMPTIVLVVIAVYKISHDGMGYGEFIA